MKKAILLTMLICVLSCLLLAGCALSDGSDASSANTDATESRFDGAQAQNPGSASAEHMESADGVPQDTSSSNLSLAENADSLTMEINPSQAALSDKEFLLTFRNSEDTQFYYGLEYTLEHYDGGEWKSVGFVPGFEIRSAAYLGADGTELEISLDNHDYAFEAGRYRVAKTILGKTLYAEFEILG